MTFGEDLGWVASIADSEHILSTYVDRGGNFVGTTNVYTNGHSEQIGFANAGTTVQKN